jgi:hypothetical protein
MSAFRFPWCLPVLFCNGMDEFIEDLTAAITMPACLRCQKIWSFGPREWLGI